MAFFVFDYRQTLLFNNITMWVIACILDFNNGLEYYQAANTLITSLVLWVFDNSIFHCHLLCLMPLNTQKRRRRSNGNIWREAIVWLHVTYSIPYFPTFYRFYSSFHSTCAASRVKDCPCQWLKKTFWLIFFSICLASFELKLDGHLDRTAVTLVSPPGQSDTHTHRLRGGEEKREGWCRSNFSGLWADSSSTGRAGNHGGNNVYIDQLSGRFMASFCCNGELVGRLSATQHHRLLPVSRPGNLSLPRSKPNTCDSTSTCPNSIKRKCWN